MPVNCHYVMAVIDDNLAAVPGVHGGFGHSAVGGGAHRRTGGRVNVDAGVEGAFAVDWVLALAETGADAALKRPERGCVGQLGPVAGKAGRKSALEGAGNLTRHGLGAQRIKLVDGELHLLLRDIVGRSEAGGSGLSRCTRRSLGLG